MPQCETYRNNCYTNNIKPIMEKLDKLNDKVECKFNEVSLDIARLPEKLIERLDDRYADKKTEKIIDKLTITVIVAVVLAVMALIVGKAQ